MLVGRKMTTEDFLAWLVSEGFQERRRLSRKAQFLGEADFRVSLQHADLGWAHVSRYDRQQTVSVECVLVPGVLGTRTVHRTLSAAAERLFVVRSRADHGPGKVWSEKPRRTKRDSPWR